jgi:hypothetical protein
VNHADFWVVMFLAVGLKLPLIGLFFVIWKAAKLGDQAQAALPGLRRAHGVGTDRGAARRCRPRA